MEVSGVREGSSDGGGITSGEEEASKVTSGRGAGRGVLVGGSEGVGIMEDASGEISGVVVASGTGVTSGEGATATLKETTRVIVVFPFSIVPWAIILSPTLISESESGA